MTSTIAALRIITDDVARLASFYETLLGVTATWATPDFAEIRTTTLVLAIGGPGTVAVFGPGAARPARNHNLIIDVLVPDVNAEHERLKPVMEVVQEPVDLPWGNRSLLVRDPDGTLVNLFTPVTEQAIARWSAV